MPVTIANTLTTSTFDFWRNRTNELADAMSRVTITVDSNTASGNAFVNGHFGANTLVATNIRGGNVTITTALTVTSNVIIATGNTLTVGNSSVNVVINTTSISFNNTAAASISLGNSSVNVAINTSSVSINSIPLLPVFYAINVATSGTSAQLADSFLFASFRAAEYVLTVRDTGANSIQATKALVVCDGGDAYITEFGIVTSNAALGALSANANATHVRVYITPTVSAAAVKGQRQIVVL